jgi:hypothetical protein
MPDTNSFGRKGRTSPGGGCREKPAGPLDVAVAPALRGERPAAAVSRGDGVAAVVVDLEEVVGGCK